MTVGKLVGKRALVTGGASGIGLATARRLVADGADVLVIDVDVESGEAAAEAAGARFLAADVSSSADWEKVIGVVAETSGGLDFVHLNAGIMSHESNILELSDEVFNRVLGVNLGGVVYGIRATAGLLSEGGGGSIVVTSSIGGLAAFPQDPVYVASKHALTGLVRALVPSMEALGISINAICPGPVDTPLADRELARLGVLPGTDLGAMTPDQLADAVVDALTAETSGGVYLVLGGQVSEIPAFDLQSVMPAPP